MVKVKDDSAWMTEEGVNLTQWFDHLEQKGYRSGLPLIRHACALSQLAGAEHPTETGFSCFRQGIAMAEALVDLSVDAEVIAAAIVFDGVQHADLAIEDVEEQLGPGVAKLIKGVKQMSVLSAFHVDRQYGKNKHQLDNVRKMLLAMVDDVRVVLIKLAERLCVLRNLSELPHVIRKQISTEVMDVFAPLANRLGIGVFKWEMEDLAFRYLEPEIYKQVAKGLHLTRIERDLYVNKIVVTLTEALENEHLQGLKIYGRAKHIRSIYNKMQRKHVSLNQIYDAIAIRVLVDKPEDCYQVLSLVHSLWEPVSSEFDDYINQPKPNGYQSLHTAVIGPENCVFEVQIRTHHMHDLAEMGVAAHWKYKEGTVITKPTHERKIEWLREVLSWHKEMALTSESSAVLEREFLDDRIYVFTPNGEVLDMPQGSTPLDFAYFVHSQLGHRCRGAKVNGNMVPLTSVLQTGDRVEVLTSKIEKPSRDWMNPHLRYLTTSRAKAKVLHWFKTQDYEMHVEQGRALLDKELKSLGAKTERLSELPALFHFKTLDDCYAALGRGEIRLTQMINRLIPPDDGSTSMPNLIKKSPPRYEHSNDDLQIEGVGKLLTNMARCCQPLPGDQVIGYVTIGRGVSIHRMDCSNIIHSTEKQRRRFLQVTWGEVTKEKYIASLFLQAFDRVDLLKDITAVLAIEKAHIHALKTEVHQPDNHVFIFLTVEVPGVTGLSGLLTKLLQVPNVLEARRQV
ncbi:MAG: bifunctional (p)ppGpp synthetase/guanosine-3',5'-bis(diphosphate) 3'-pyrophosphohydrolase [Gammaproteobacteria bacterium]|nr:bifunctional (p)ppGpp synthetase/guanosine-3',5'-bis(diphosphate) 3'-pyrophosphohydrolase [Gammaproteobacteria bacterium]